MSESLYLNPTAEKGAVRALGEDIGYGRIIQLAHECWDESLEAKHGIKNHSEGWTLAAADIIRERRAARAEGPAPVSAPLDREGVARIIDPDGFARREQHLRVSAEWHEKAEKFAATENPAPYPDGRFAVERIVEAWRGVAEKHATYAETDVRHAYAKADAILALSQQVGLTTPAASTDGAR